MVLMREGVGEKERKYNCDVKETKSIYEGLFAHCGMIAISRTFVSRVVALLQGWWTLWYASNGMSVACMIDPNDGKLTTRKTGLEKSGDGAGQFGAVVAYQALKGLEARKGRFHTAKEDSRFVRAA